LQLLGVEIISTGGTATALAKTGVVVQPVEKFTGYPEMLGGRVKTLHPKVHGGILWRRGHPEDHATVLKYGLQSIDLVCVNLYPFADTVAKGRVRRMCRANRHRRTRHASLRGEESRGRHRPRRSGGLRRALTDLRDGNPLSPEARRHLAWKVFVHTAAYDATIAAYFAGHIVA